jgi:uncharacterized membrane protein YdjX (TVP38/TMEM64 family)
MSRRPLPATTRTRSRFVLAIALLVVLVALAVAWRVTPLARFGDPGTIAAYRDQVRDLPLAPVWVVLVFVVGNFVAAPATLMIGATTLLFGPAFGAAYAWLGMMVSGSLVFALTRLAARRSIDEWLARRAGSWVDVFGRRLQRRGFVAVMLMRFTPVPFTLQNVLAGASRIGYADFAGGSAVGILPVIALMAGVTTEFTAWLADPQWSRLAMLIGAVVVAIAAGWALRRWAVGRTLDR